MLRSRHRTGLGLLLLIRLGLLQLVSGRRMLTEYECRYTRILTIGIGSRLFGQVLLFLAGQHLAVVGRGIEYHTLKKSLFLRRTRTICTQEDIYDIIGTFSLALLWLRIEIAPVGAVCRKSKCTPGRNFHSQTALQRIGIRLTGTMAKTRKHRSDKIWISALKVGKGVEFGGIKTTLWSLIGFSEQIGEVGHRYQLPRVALNISSTSSFEISSQSWS